MKSSLNASVSLVIGGLLASSSAIAMAQDAGTATAQPQAGLEDIDLKDLETLTGMKTAIKDGDTTIEAAFPAAAPAAAGNGASKTENLADNLKKKAAASAA